MQKISTEIVFSGGKLCEPKFRGSAILASMRSRLVGSVLALLMLLLGSDVQAEPKDSASKEVKKTEKKRKSRPWAPKQGGKYWGLVLEAADDDGIAALHLAGKAAKKRGIPAYVSDAGCIAVVKGEFTTDKEYLLTAVFPSRKSALRARKKLREPALFFGKLATFCLD